MDTCFFAICALSLRSCPHVLLSHFHFQTESMESDWLIVMTPIRRGIMTTMECVRTTKGNIDEKQVAHVATGVNQGIIIYRAIVDDSKFPILLVL